MSVRTLRTVYPCCGGRSVIRAALTVPRERYDRTCSSCGRHWVVTRTTLREEAGAAVDALSWSPARNLRQCAQRG